MSLHLVNLTSKSEGDSVFFVELFPFVGDVLFDRVFIFLDKFLCVFDLMSHDRMIRLVGDRLIQMRHTLDTID